MVLYAQTGCNWLGEMSGTSSSHNANCTALFSSLAPTMSGVASGSSGAVQGSASGTAGNNAYVSLLGGGTP
jgi:hypothetical protein